MIKRTGKMVLCPPCQNIFPLRSQMGLYFTLGKADDMCGENAATMVFLKTCNATEHFKLKKIKIRSLLIARKKKNSGSTGC